MPFFRQRPDGDRQKGNVIDNIKLSRVIAISQADGTSQVAAECDCVSVGRDT
jgi:hypothetical protein